MRIQTAIRRATWAIVTAVALIGVTESRAAQITLALSGQIIEMDPGYAPLAGLSLGDTFTGGFVYDTTTADSNPDASTGQYHYVTSNPAFDLLESPLGINLQFSNGTLIAPNYVLGGMQVQVFNNVLNPELGPVDAMAINQTTVINGTPTTSGEFLALFLIDHSQTAFSSDALPASLSLSCFDQIEFQLIRPNTAGSTVLLRLALGATAVPEPSSIVLAGLGFLTLTGLVRRRSRELSNRS